MQDRLLNAYLAGTVDDATYAAKSAELKGEALKAEETIERLNGDAPIDAELGLRLFDWSQNVVDLWLGSNITQKREILDLLSLNRTLGDLSLVLQKRKPFDFLAERLDLKNSRGDCRSFEPCMPGYVDTLLRPDPYLQQSDRLTRQCA